MKDNNQCTDRRAMLKGIIAGSAVVTGSKALPETWVKPISDAVVIPGHAITTNGDYTGGDGGYGSANSDIESEGDGDKIDKKSRPSGDYTEHADYGDYDEDRDDFGSDDDHNNDDYVSNF